MLKKRASGGDITKTLSAPEYLICSAQASSHIFLHDAPSASDRISRWLCFHLGAVTAVITNPLWLVRVRMFTSQVNSPNAYRGLWGTRPRLSTDSIFWFSSAPLSHILHTFRRHFAFYFLWNITEYICNSVTHLLDGLSTIFHKEGTLGLFRGTTLALVGVSNGAIQFVAYEKMKAWGFDRKRRQYEQAGKVYDREADKLVCIQTLASTRICWLRLLTRISPRWYS